MDYEPGKVPRKEEWDKQTTTKTQPQNSFLSNVKLVGDDMTEKDYDTFFEGFKSVNEKPLWEEPKLWQTPKVPTLPKRSLIDAEPKRKTISYNPLFGSGAKIETSPYRPSDTNETKIQFLPYRPSTDGETKFQPLPYIPAKDGDTKYTLYSADAPTYVQAKNTPQKSEETWWGKLRESIDDSWNLDEYLTEKINELPQNAYPTIAMSTTPFPLSLLRIAAGRALEDHVKEKHYERNQQNVDLPKTADEAKAWDWKTVAANCHQFTAENGERYVKYVSPDGKREVIFNEKGDRVITADEDEGTYNYADPDWKFQHGILDVLPWIVYGNTPQDTTEWYQRVGGLFNFEKQKNI